MNTCCYMPGKDPISILDYQFDWRSWMQEGESIIGTPIISAPSLILNPTGEATTVISNVVTFWLGGGTIGETIVVSCEISTNQGRTDERSFDLNIIER